MEDNKEIINSIWTERSLLSQDHEGSDRHSDISLLTCPEKDMDEEI